MLIVMMKGMYKKLDEALQESARSGRSISKLNLSRMDDHIVTAFHISNVLEIATKKIKPNTKIIQVLELMGELLLKLTSVTLQQGVFQEPIWDPTENPTFWYHEGMLPNSIDSKTDLSQTENIWKS
jgi:hypothetical protein